MYIIKIFVKIAQILGSLGAFLLGVSAIIALCKTDSVLKEIFKIQDQAKQVEVGVEELKSANQELKKILADMDNKFTKYFATDMVQSTIIKDKNATLDQIRESVETIPEIPTCGTGSIYLPKNLRESIVNELKNASPEQRIDILQKALRYQPSCELKK